MCQLTLVTSAQPVLNKILLYTLIQANCFANRDGTGMYNPETRHFLKNAKSADTIKDVLAGAISTEDAYILMGHVRAASLTEGKKLIEDAKSHPFLSPHFVLMHNGGLERRDKKYRKEDEGLIDSEIFLNELENIYKSEKDMIKCLNKTMDNFHGKFAFLIHNLDEDEIYVVRGKTADLHVCDIQFNGELIGSIINTSDTTPVKPLEELTYLYAIWNGRLQFSKFTELKEETVYKLNKPLFDVEIVGTIKETPKPFVYNQGYDYSSTIETSDAAKLVKGIKELGLTFEELDKLFIFATGRGLVQCTYNDVRVIFDIMDDLKKRHDNFKGSNDYWERIKKALGYPPIIEIYNKYNLQFPFFLAPDLRKLCFQLENEAKKNVSIVWQEFFGAEFSFRITRATRRLVLLPTALDHPTGNRPLMVALVDQALRCLSGCSFLLIMEACSRAYARQFRSPAPPPRSPPRRARPDSSAPLRAPGILQHDHAEGTGDADLVAAGRLDLRPGGCG